MEKVNIDAIPNQTATRLFDGISYDIKIRSFNRIMYADVSADGESLSSGVRCVNNGWLIPYPALVKDGCGNFRFESMDDSYPYYTAFGGQCTLMYYTNEEYRKLISG